MSGSVIALGYTIGVHAVPSMVAIACADPLVEAVHRLRTGRLPRRSPRPTLLVVGRGRPDQHLPVTPARRSETRASTCRRSCRRSCGCSTPAKAARPIPTTHAIGAGARHRHNTLAFTV